MEVAEILAALQPLLNQLVVVAASALIVVLIQLIRRFQDWLVNKVGETTYNRAREVAIGLYTLLEDEFKDVVSAGTEKRAKMEELLLNQFPSLSEVELAAINKEVWEFMQKEVADSKLLDPVRLEGTQ